MTCIHEQIRTIARWLFTYSENHDGDWSYPELVEMVQQKYIPYHTKESAKVKKGSRSAMLEHEPSVLSDYLMDSFYRLAIRDYLQLSSGGLPAGEWNPFRQTRRGVPVYSETVEDIRNLDLWQPDSSFATPENAGRAHARHGMNNAHIVGAHRRHHDHDASEAFTGLEVGPTRTWGYNRTHILDKAKKHIDWEV